MLKGLKSLFGRERSSEPELDQKPCLDKSGTTELSVDRFHAFTQLDSSFRNTEIGEAVRKGYVVSLKGENNEEYLIGTRRVSLIKN